MVERFALVVALLMLQQRHLLDVQNRLSGDLLGDLLRDGGPVWPRAVLDRAAAIGHDLSRPHVLALLTVDAAVRATIRLPELARAAAEPGPVPLVGPHDGALRAAAARRTRSRRRAAPRPGQGRPGGRRAGDGHHGRRTGGPRPGRRSRDRVPGRPGRGGAAPGQRPGRFRGRRPLGLSALLLETGTPDARRFAATVLLEVEAHEQRRGGDLIATLRAWLSAGCSTAAAAKPSWCTAIR